MFDLAVSHDLLILPDASIEEIHTVISHPQALGQCADYIREKGWSTVEYANTALAAKYVAEKGDREIAAIASEGAAEIFGHQMRIVTSESMAANDAVDVSKWDIKSIPLSSMVFVQLVPEDPAEAKKWYEDLGEGDVLTFRYVYTTQVTITHRITDITPKGSGYVITLQGDNRDTEGGQGVQIIDTTVPNNTNYVVGKVVGQSLLLGVVLGFLMQPVGIVFIIIVPCALIILSEALKIAKVLGAEKRQKLQEEKEKTEAEIADLRKRLAELEQGKADAAENSTEEETK
jgi:hypothetical protein